MTSDHVSAAWPLVLGIFIHDAVPGALTWAVHAFRGLDLLSEVVSPAITERLGSLGLLVSVSAAIVASEAFARSPRRSFSWGYFFGALLLLALGLLPFLAAPYDINLGMSPETLGLIAHYGYLGLEVAIGVITGGSIALVLRRVSPV